MALWGDVRRECVHLGFEKDSAYDKYHDQFITAVNRAILLIAATVKPVVGRIQITQKAQAGNGYVSYDLDALTFAQEEEARRVFLEFAPDPILWTRQEGGSWTALDDFRREDKRLWLPAALEGIFEVVYHRIPKAVDKQTPDEEAIDLDDEAAALVPLLAAHYLWLDDDERKAILYWNEFDDLKNQLAQKHTPVWYPATFSNTTGWY